jgi:hypothetical protein
MMMYSIWDPAFSYRAGPASGRRSRDVAAVPGRAQIASNDDDDDDDS